ncbi:hypothetical protein ZEAMMB73_Zm00001d020404 [Zea mays]|uniref:Uncharacterized protein n=1 Tax=Zea mays TaxID=4577 RepID=A0A1D6I403_MAIZE|nr:hypothetical protein ZEAMMB73_Zm00001d020404 [Zea mays]
MASNVVGLRSAASPLLYHFLKVYFTERYIEYYGISCHCKPSLLGSSVVCGRDCYCSMLFSCCSSQCECDITSTNKSFQHRPLTKTKLVNPNRGGLTMVKEILRILGTLQKSGTITVEKRGHSEFSEVLPRLPITVFWPYIRRFLEDNNEIF